MDKGTRVWLRGLIAAIIGGGASAVTGGVSVSVIDPAHFNFSGQVLPTVKLMGALFVLNALISLFAYLKQSPIPPEEN